MPLACDGLQKRGDDGEEHCGHVVCHAERVLPNEVDAHAEDEDGPNQGEVGDCGRDEDGLDQAGQTGERSLDDKDRDDGEQASLAHRYRHGAYEQRIDGAFERKHGPVAAHAVPNGPHHAHGADAGSERRGDEAIDKRAVTVAARAVFEPFPEALHLELDIEKLAYQGAEHERYDDHGRLPAHELAVHDAEHSAERPGEPDEDNGDGGGLHEGVLKMLGHESAEEDAADAACKRERDVDQRADSHGGLSS